MSFIVSEIMDGSAALLNDTARTVFTYAAQLPYFKIAYDDLKLELEDNNIPFSSKSSATITVPLGIDNIGGLTGPALPVDLIDIIAVWARPSGGTDFHFLTRKSYLSISTPALSDVYEFAWREQTIFIGNTNSAMEIRIDYVGDPFEVIVDETTVGKVFNATNFLKYRNAALCAEFIGENKERADSLNINALRVLEILLNVSIKSSQSISTRRRKFRGRI